MVTRVLFVCMGNICRSPTAEGVFRKLVAERAAHLELEIDSAGTHGYHVGDPPDPRSIEAAARRGVDLTPLRARKVGARDFERFDLILAMDRLNRETLIDRCPPEYHSRVRLFLEFAPGIDEQDVPDPYYGGPAGFEQVLDLVEEACVGLLDEVRRQVTARR
ncbi:MAG: low molecular weight protein-tyrosine-phosphatase [Steroidobacteraceae bacterium]